MQRTTLGDFELTHISDGYCLLDGGAYFGVVPKTMWQKKMPADDLNRVHSGINSVLVRDGKRTILIETGCGNKLDDKMRKIYEPKEKLLESLHEVGVAPEDIDVVVNTHLHFDHCGWNTVYRSGKAVPTFPNAKYYVQEGEWKAAQHPSERDRISYIYDNYNPLVESGHMQLLRGDTELFPGVSVRIFAGHTEFMQAVMLESGGKKACYIADLIPTSSHLDVAWGMGFDLYPLQVIANKKRFYAEAVPGNWLVLFTHDEKTPWGYVEQIGEGKYRMKS